MTQVELENSILNAAHLLMKKASDLSADINTEKVHNIYITLQISPGETPTLEISKSYYVDKRDIL